MGCDFFSWVGGGGQLHGPQKLLSKLESAKNSLFQSVNEVLAVKSAKETMRLRSQSENFGVRSTAIN